jgi:predicted sulfurtransferase
MTRTIALFSALIIAAGALIACNSSDNVGPQIAAAPMQQPQQNPNTQPSPPPPSDGARRITAEELHALWEKNKVLIIDTRDEASYKNSHIKGAISIPSNQVLGKIDELPRDKMIVAYCT